MTKKITNRDLETLSAYLDEQLTSRERAQLERRLQKDQELQNEIEQLRRTRQLIRNLPKVRAPRNFTLSPEMAGIRKVPRPYPIYRLASALATILLALVLISDFLGGQQFTQAPQPEKALLGTPAPSIAAAQEIPPESPMGGGAAEQQTSESTEEVMSLAAPSTTETPMPTGEAVRMGAPGKTSQAPAAALAEKQASEPAPETTGEAAADGVIEGSTPIPPGEMTVEPELSPTAISEATPTSFTRGLSYRILEVVLALIALITGFAAIITRRGTSA